MRLDTEALDPDSSSEDDFDELDTEEVTVQKILSIYEYDIIMFLHQSICSDGTLTLPLGML